MGQNFPDDEGYGYTFSRGEITLNKKIYSSITNVSLDQPTEESSTNGNKPYPIRRSAGKMGMGAGTVTFADEAERLDFIDDLGDDWREKICGITYVLRQAATGKEKKIACKSCRCLSEPIEHGEGEDLVGGDINFSYMSHTVNGKKPHA